MSKSLVIVESPAKARTLKRYLGNDFDVRASVGHVKDLPPSGLGVDVDNAFATEYRILPDKQKVLRELTAAARKADTVYLAPDPDREGEAIAWHIAEVLREKIKNVDIKRATFQEITAEAVRQAIEHPRELDQNLFAAQQTRRILDRLVGYQLSPLLWKKVMRNLSAGRVQSVAVRLVVERERERRAFHTATWWDVQGEFSAGEHGTITADLVRWQQRRIAKGRDFDERTGELKDADKVTLIDEATATDIVAVLRGVHAQKTEDAPGDATVRVERVEEKRYTERPAPPFITSTLQQECNRKLRWPARRTMTMAQRLYENGWITYMRTDSTTLSQQAIDAARDWIANEYSKEYLPKEPRRYRGKAKHAQEAHEAIRPAGSRFRSLDEAKRELDQDAFRLYELIWMRTVACQMADARGRRMTVTLAADEAQFAATGKTIDFPGYRRAYVEGSDDPGAVLADQERVLPPVREGDALTIEALTPREHETKPPARLTEATLVKEMEQRGIGRPSTYATIIQKILEKKYVFKKGNALVPSFTAFAVTNLLEQHLDWLVDYDFSAQMEAALDEVALGKQDWLAYLSEFYRGRRGLDDQLKAAEADANPREVCSIPIGEDDDGTLIEVRVGRFGPFLYKDGQTANVPDDLPPDELTVEKAQELLRQKQDGPRELGADLETGKPILVLNGRYGPYLQVGENDADSKAKPKRASLLKGMDPETVDLETARKLLALPRKLGTHPDTDEDVLAANGRYGPYVRCGKQTCSIPASLHVLEITLAQALELLREAPRKRRGPEPLRTLGEDPRTDRTIKLMDGRYGPYVTDGKTNASLPKDEAPDGIDINRAIELIQARENKPKRKRRTRKRSS